MKLTAIDIAHKAFNKKMFGLDEAEVNDFLQQLASTVEELTVERNALREAVREKEFQLNEFKQNDNILKNTISTAGQMVDRLRADAEREAKLIIADAQQKAEAITRDSRDSLKRIYQEIAELKRVRMQFEANLKALAQAHLSLVEQGEKFMPSISLPNIPAEGSEKSAAASFAKNSAISPLSIG